MTVYAIVQVDIFEREAYDRYQSKFWNVFKQFSGTLVVNTEHAKVLEGEWPYSKMVVVSFPSEASFHQWADSPEYAEIVGDRRAGANVTIVLTEEFKLHG